MGGELLYGILVNVLLTYHYQVKTRGGLGALARALTSKFSIFALATLGDTGEPMGVPMICL